MEIIYCLNYRCLLKTIGLTHNYRNSIFLLLLFSGSMITGCDPFKSASKREKALAQERARIIQKEQHEQRMRDEAEATARFRLSISELIQQKKESLKAEAQMVKTCLSQIDEDKRMAESQITLSDRRGAQYTLYSLLTNQTLTSLAVKYTGADFSALQSEFTEKIKFLNTDRQMTQRQLQKNAEMYMQEVEGIDEAVARANEGAAKELARAVSNVGDQIKKLEWEKRTLEKGLQSPRSRQRLEWVNEELNRLYLLENMNSSSATHQKATTLESSARKKTDNALLKKGDRDADVLVESQLRNTVYSITEVYRGRSIDKLLSAMDSKRNVLFVKLADIEHAFITLDESERKMDFMGNGDLAKLRDTISQSTTEKLGEVLK